MLELVHNNNIKKSPKIFKILKKPILIINFLNILWATMIIIFGLVSIQVDPVRYLKYIFERLDRKSHFKTFNQKIIINNRE